MEKKELLYDHYKETFSLIKDSIKERNRFFILLFVVMGFQFLLAVVPDSIISLAVKVVSNIYNIDISEQFIVIQNILWLVLLYFTMRYYQTTVIIERQYKYIHKLEDTISILFEIKFDRESKNYLEYYPKMNDMIDLIYKWVFPILYCMVICIKICVEIRTTVFGFSIIFDCLMFFSCFVLTILYLVFLHGKKPADDTRAGSE